MNGISLAKLITNFWTIGTSFRVTNTANTRSKSNKSGHKANGNLRARSVKSLYTHVDSHNLVCQ